MSTQPSRTVLDPNIGPWLAEQLSWIAKKPPVGELSAPRRNGPEVLPLAGDGSQRTFYRVTWDGASWVLVRDPGFVATRDYFPIQRFLAERGLPVPQFFAEDAARGFLLMEDFGDELLQQRILADPSKRFAWLESATQLLGQLHGATFPVPSSVPAAQRRFDTTKYREELAFTHTHLAEKLLGVPPREEERRAVEAFCASIDGFGPAVFSHRDYHTRNILVRGDALFLIDFQDARLGPPQYDLASLLYDAYVPAREEERDRLLATYRTAVDKFPLGPQIEWARFEKNLVAVALQRMAKAAGSFASFYTRFGKSTHLPFLLPCLDTVAALQQRARAQGSLTTDLFPVDQWRAQWQKHALFAK